MYVHIYKTGGSSTTEVLIPYIERKFRKSRTRTKEVNWQQTWHLGKQHATLAESLLKLNKLGIDPQDYFLFVFVRNPYTWILSLWDMCYSQPYRKRSPGLSGNIKFIAKKVFKNKTQDLLQNQTFYQHFPNASFQDFLLFIDRIYRTGSDRERRFWGTYDQYSFLENDRGIEFDFIGRLENIAEDMSYLADKLDLTEYDRMPHRAFKENKIIRQKYLDFYDSKSIEIVNKIFSRDFEMFGYSQIEPSRLFNLTR